MLNKILAAKWVEIAALDEVGKSLEKFTHVNGGAMQIEEPLRDHCDRDYAASQDGPHEQAALLDVVDHRILS